MKMRKSLMILSKLRRNSKKWPLYRSSSQMTCDTKSKILSAN